MVGPDWQTPPGTAEVEVSLFGPGFGECVVVHLGNNQWMLVDSCLDSATCNPISIEYLKQLGVQPSKAVTHIVATHWHDDHIGGLAQAFQSSSSAAFWCSMALQSEDLLALTEYYGGFGSQSGSGVDELREVIRELQRRKRRSQISSPKFAISGRALLERDTSPRARVVALAPSDSAVTITQTRIRDHLLPKTRKRRMRVPDFGPNDGAIVLSMSVGGVSFLLGTDLEERNRDGIGWRVILEEYPSDDSPFEGFKVPHHGSETGDHPGVWEHMLVANPIAALTPFVRGHNRIPTQSDINRILGRTDSAYITAPPALRRFKHPVQAVRKTIEESNIEVYDEPSYQGQIRLRRQASSATAPWRVELFGNAMHLADLPSS